MKRLVTITLLFVLAGTMLSGCVSGVSSSSPGASEIEYNVSAGPVESPIATINGEAVSAAEFRLALFEQQLSMENTYGGMTPEMWTQDTGMGYTMADIAKNNALNSLIIRKLANIKAAGAGQDVLTEEQQANLDNIMETFPIAYGDGVMDYIGLSEAEMYRAFSESFYSDNMYYRIIGGYELNQEALDEAFEAYFTGNEDVFTMYKFSYIMTNTREEIDAAMAEYAEGAEFMDIVEKYSIEYIVPPEPAEPEEPAGDGAGEDAMEPVYDESTGGLILDLSDMVIDPNIITIPGEELSPDFRADLYALEPGETSEVIELYADDMSAVEQYLVMYLVEKTEPDKEYEKSVYEYETYIPEAEQALYQQEIQSWFEEFEIVVNEETFDTAVMYSN